MKNSTFIAGLCAIAIAFGGALYGIQRIVPSTTSVDSGESFANSQGELPIQKTLRCPDNYVLVAQRVPHIFAPPNMGRSTPYQWICTPGVYPTRIQSDS